MAWFTGTSTGDRYTVGEVYSNGNGSFRAMSDGSFRNIESGHRDVGSSQDARTMWGGSSIVERSSSPQLWSNDPDWRGDGGSSVSSGGGGNGGAGAGSASVVAGGRTAETTGPGSGSALSVGFNGRSKGPGGIVLASNKFGKTTPIIAGGVEYGRDAGWSDTQDVESRWGEGDGISPTFFYQWGVFGADTITGIGNWTRKHLRETVVVEPTYPMPRLGSTPQERETERILRQMIPKY